jgi:hypothetical protein
MSSFLPLFMVEEVGLSDSYVVQLQNGILIGSLVSVAVWGWLADRYGSMPVMLSGLLMRLFLPVFWLLMPKESPWSLYLALGIAFLQGISNMGWGIGSGRLLFVSIVPPEKKTDYMALYYAWVGVVGGVSQLVGGWMLDYFQDLSGQLLFIELNAYSPLFLMGLALPLFSLYSLRGVARDGAVDMGTFAGFLFRGNPFMAVESLIRYHMAKDEQTAVRLTERLGRARSLLTVEELLESLADPRFNVRFEAIAAIGRTRPDEQLIKALAQVLHGTDPALSVMAAWALGRIHDERARDTLYAALDSGYRSVRAHSARSLGTLGDKTAVPELLRRLVQEADHGLQVAYASALGHLHATEAVGPILQLLRKETDETIRLELALALARLAGEEHGFVHLARQMRGDAGTALAQTVVGLERKWQKAWNPALARDPVHLIECSALFSLGDLEAGFAALGHFLTSFPLDVLPPLRQTIMAECAACLAQFGPARPEYALLALHILMGSENS